MLWGSSCNVYFLSVKTAKHTEITLQNMKLNHECLCINKLQNQTFSIKHKKKNPNMITFVLYSLKIQNSVENTAENRAPNKF